MTKTRIPVQPVSAGARQLAAALLNAADTLDALT
jgi:hypothetical protein